PQQRPRSSGLQARADLAGPPHGVAQDENARPLRCSGSGDGQGLVLGGSFPTYLLDRTGLANGSVDPPTVRAVASGYDGVRQSFRVGAIEPRSPTQPMSQELR